MFSKGDKRCEVIVADCSRSTNANTDTRFHYNGINKTVKLEQLPMMTSSLKLVHCLLHFFPAFSLPILLLLLCFYRVWILQRKQCTTPRYSGAVMNGKRHRPVRCGLEIKNKQMKLSSCLKALRAPMPPLFMLIWLRTPISDYSTPQTTLTPLWEVKKHTFISRMLNFVGFELGIFIQVLHQRNVLVQPGRDADTDERAGRGHTQEVKQNEGGSGKGKEMNKNGNDRGKE